MAFIQKRPFFSGEAIRRLQGIVLVRVPTFRAVLDPRWFLGRIRDCELGLAESFATKEQRAGILGDGD